MSATCPLCGGDNQCAMAQGKPAAECWCQRVTIPAEVLAQVPESLLGRACICADCAPLDSRLRGNDDLAQCLMGEN